MKADDTGLNVCHDETRLTVSKPVLSHHETRLTRRHSAQQKFILHLLEKQPLDISELVARCFGKVHYGKNPNNKKQPYATFDGHKRKLFTAVDEAEVAEHRAYMAAYASVSRAVRQLEEQGLVTCKWYCPKDEKGNYQRQRRKVKRVQR